MRFRYVLLGMCGLLLLSLFLAPQTSRAGLSLTTPSAYDFSDDFDSFNATNWDVYLFRSPDFDYDCGTYVDGETWVYCSYMTTGTNSEYNGYRFVHELAAPYTDEFQVETEVCWSASSTSSIYKVGIRLLSPTDDPTDNEAFRIRVAFNDPWSASGGNKKVNIEGTITQTSTLPLSGRGEIRIGRNATNGIFVYWDDALIAEGESSSTISKIALEIHGHDDYTGGSGGINYVYCQSSFTPSEDNYEPNNDRTSAYDLSLQEQTWLSTINGSGVQFDDDYYEIDVTSGFEDLLVELSFTHAFGDLNLEVYDAVGTFVTGSYSVTNDEYIDVSLPSSGTYYLRIFNADNGNTYDLWWDDGQDDDAYEENDARTSAYDLSYDEQTWLSTIGGLGAQWDEDWYELYMTPGYTFLTVELTFDDTYGDLNLEVYDATGTFIIGSYSTTDDEYIITNLPDDGTFYLLVFNANNGNTYDLWWDDTRYDDAYEENDYWSTAYDLSSYEDEWLSDIDGFGIQWDSDYFEIYVSSGESRLQVWLDFTDSEGDLDLQILDSDGDNVASSTSVSDDEYLDITVTPGIYYLRVYYSNTGNIYDLRWLSSVSDTTTTTTTTTFTPSPIPLPLLMFILALGVISILVVIFVIITIFLMRRKTSRSSRISVSERPWAPASTRPSDQHGAVAMCPNCGTTIEPSDQYCLRCGKLLR